jgi:hypothetical protein
MTQPEALRLAEKLDVGEISYTGMCKAAAELRRLHEVNTELLAALNTALLWHSNPQKWLDQAYAAINNAEGART